MTSDVKTTPATGEIAKSASGDPYLLTPGPLTTSIRVKQAMLHDYGSRDLDFIELNRRVCTQLLELADAVDSHVCVPLQGSGTFAVEAMLASMIPASGKLLNLVNGAYGHRITEICQYIKRDCIVQETAENKVVDTALLDEALEADTDITHVSVVYCETTSGILNPIVEVAEIVARHKRALLIDAMSAFGALPLSAGDITFQALAASSNKCLQGVPGMAFCLADREALEKSEGNAHSLSLDLCGQARAMKANGQWRFTPPVHCMLALAEALDELAEEGGVAARGERYSANCRILRDGLGALGFRNFLPDRLQAPVIVTFKTPKPPAFDFKTFYDRLAAKGYIIYPGKVTREDTFRVGCIGDIGSNEMHAVIRAVQITLAEMGLEDLTSIS